MASDQIGLGTCLHYDWKVDLTLGNLTVGFGLNEQIHNIIEILS